MCTMYEVTHTCTCTYIIMYMCMYCTCAPVYSYWDVHVHASVTTTYPSYPRWLKKIFTLNLQTKTSFNRDAVKAGTGRRWSPVLAKPTIM